MSSSAVAAQPSYIVIPEHIAPNESVFHFLVKQFPHIEADIWQQRIQNKKVHWQNGSTINLPTLCRPKQRIYYYREVQHETKVPFEEQILFENERILIVHKPHFLPVTPSGNYVNECLVHRLRLRTGIDTIAPAHRLDKDTAGLMLMTKSAEFRCAYHNLFKSGDIHKQYQALAHITPEIKAQFEQHGAINWTIKNRLVRSEPSFLVKQIEGEANTHSEIRLVEINENLGLFELEPITGKTHQLRVHMLGLGMPILNDRFYPVLQPKAAPNFSQPLKLLAQKLEFTDPFDMKKYQFITPSFHSDGNEF